MPVNNELGAEDAKLITLAMGARGRIAATEGAAVRDEMGRTYSGASIRVGEFQLSAIELAIAQSVAAGARGLELAVILGAEQADLSLIRNFAGDGTPVLQCSASGEVLERLVT